MRGSGRLVGLVCAGCQELFQAKRRDATHCRKCRLAQLAEYERNRRQARRIGRRRELVCKDCGASFVAKRKDALRCEPCKVLMHQQSSRTFEAKRYAAGYRRPHPTAAYRERVLQDRVCVECAAVFQAIRSDAQRCPTCKKARRLQQGAVSSRRTKYDNCPDCGNRKFIVSERCSKCEYARRGELQRGENNPSWKPEGRYVGRDGRPQVRLPNGTWVPEHRKVWEDANGPIPHAWHVHHLNGVKTDNRLENLIALPNHEHHSRPRKAVVPYEERNRILEARLAAAGLPID